MWYYKLYTNMEATHNTETFLNYTVKIRHI